MREVGVVRGERALADLEAALRQRQRLGRVASVDGDERLV